mgnify:FL=1
MLLNKIKIPCLFSKLVNSNEDSRFLNCVIKVQHDKKNFNQTYFDEKDMIACAEKSLRLSPILGSVIYDEDSEEYRLNGHDMDYEIVKGKDGYDVKIKHIERIYGFVPHDAKITTEYDEVKDKTYLVTNGVLWKNYLDEVEDILNREDGHTEVSMEITVNESFKGEDGILHITDYEFQGITMLGVPPAMEGANLQLFSCSDISKIKIEMEELVQAYSLERREDMENVDKTVIEETTETVEAFEETVEETVETIEETIEETPETFEEEVKEEEDVEEVEQVEETEGEEVEGTETYGISTQQIVDQILPQLNERRVDRVDYWGESYQDLEFYFIDILPNENVAVVASSDFQNYKCYGIPYTVEGDVITLDFEGMKEYITEWREMQGVKEDAVEFSQENPMQEHIMKKFENIDRNEDKVAELEKLLVEYAELKEQLDAMSDYEELKQFRLSYDQAVFEKEINDITEMFSLEEEEYSELREKVMNREITQEQYKEKLALIYALKQIANAKYERAEVKVSSEIRIPFEDKTDRPYGGKFDKYLKK